MKTLLRFFLIPFLAACGGAAPPPAAPTAPPAAPAAVAAPVAPSLVDYVDGSATSGVHLDMKRARGTPLLAGLLSSLAAQHASGPLDDAKQTCGFAPLDVVDEVVLSRAEETMLLVATVTVPADRALACVKAMGHGDDAKIDDVPAVKLAGGQVIAAVKDGKLFAGDEPSVRKALKGSGDRGPIASHLAITPDIVGIGYGDVNDEPVKTVSGTLKATDQEFALDAAVALTSEAAASQLVTLARMQMAKAGGNATPEQKKLLEELVSADGKNLRLHVGVKGDAKAQAERIGTIVAMSVENIRHYTSRTKSVEARVTVDVIAKSLVSYVEGQKAKKKPALFPPSAPPVPAKVPAATTYTSKESDWSAPTWKAVGFAATDPQAYRYEVVTAPDKKHAVVRAQGDLDGDGQLSTFEESLEIDKQGNVTTTPLKVTDEME